MVRPTIPVGYPASVGYKPGGSTYQYGGAPKAFPKYRGPTADRGLQYTPGTNWRSAFPETPTGFQPAIGSLGPRKPLRPLTPEEQYQMEYDTEMRAIGRLGPDPWGRPGPGPKMMNLAGSTNTMPAGFSGYSPSRTSRKPRASGMSNTNAAVSVPGGYSGPQGFQRQEMLPFSLGVPVPGGYSGPQGYQQHTPTSPSFPMSGAPHGLVNQMFPYLDAVSGDFQYNNPYPGYQQQQRLGTPSPVDSVMGIPQSELDTFSPAGGMPGTQDRRDEAARRQEVFLQRMQAARNRRQPGPQQPWQRPPAGAMTTIPGTNIPIGDAMEGLGGALDYPRQALQRFSSGPVFDFFNKEFGGGPTANPIIRNPTGANDSLLAQPDSWGFGGEQQMFQGGPQRSLSPPEPTQSGPQGFDRDLYQQQISRLEDMRRRAEQSGDTSLMERIYNARRKLLERAQAGQNIQTGDNGFLQQFRQQLADRAAFRADDSRLTPPPRLPQPDDAMRGGVGTQRLGITDQDPTVTRMQNRDGTPNRHFVYGGGPGMGAPGLDVGQVRTHTMLPGGAGVQEIPKPWRGRDFGEVDPQRVAESRARTLYNPAVPARAQTPDEVKAMANRKRQQLQQYGDAKRAAIAQRAAEIRKNGGGVLTTDANGQPLPDSEVVANAADRARGSLPFGERAALVREKAQERSAARRQRIENRNAVPSIYDQMAMQDPRFALQGNALNAQQQMAEADRQARLREVELRNKGQLDVAAEQNKQQPIPQNVENMGILAEMPDDIKAADPQTQWEWFNNRKRMISGQQPEDIGGGSVAGGGPIPIGQQSSQFGPMVSRNDERALSQLLSRFEGQPDRQRVAIEEYGRENGWTPEQIRSAQQTALGRSWGDWLKSDVESINPDTGKYEPTTFSRGVDVLTGSMFGGPYGAAAGYFGLPALRDLFRSRAKKPGE
jgi:hypothetical protein